MSQNIAALSLEGDQGDIFLHFFSVMEVAWPQQLEMNFQTRWRFLSYKGIQLG